MKIDLKRLEGRELDADADTDVHAVEQRTSVWEDFGFAQEPGGYGRLAVAAVPLVIGGVCAAISWGALFTFLAFCAGAMVLLGGAVLWIETDSTPFH